MAQPGMVALKLGRTLEYPGELCKTKNHTTPTAPKIEILRGQVGEDRHQCSYLLTALCSPSENHCTRNLAVEFTTEFHKKKKKALLKE